MSEWRLLLRVVASVVLATTAPALNFAHACDPCSVFNAARISGPIPQSFWASVSVQNTSFDKAKTATTSRSGEQVREFNTTQLGFNYDINERFGAQLSLPFIIRRFDRFSNYRSRTEHDSGIGDLVLLGRYTPLLHRGYEWSTMLGVSAGVKLPTGDTGAITDSVSTTRRGDTGNESRLRHHPVPIASGGRVLTFGTGSTDALLGVNSLTRYGRALFLVEAQYGIRTTGDFDYRFANDLIISGGPGYDLYRSDSDVVTARVPITGEFKAHDTLEGSPVFGSAISNTYVGPELLVSIGDRTSGLIAVDFRTSGEDPNAAIVPIYRLRASLAYRF
jgi:hypothetical protein